MHRRHDPQQAPEVAGAGHRGGFFQARRALANGHRERTQTKNGVSRGIAHYEDGRAPVHRRGCRVIPYLDETRA